MSKVQENGYKTSTLPKFKAKLQIEITANITKKCGFYVDEKKS